MRALICLLALSVTIPAAPALAQEAPAPAPASAKVTDKSDPDYVRCRSESVIGSRAKKRKVCLTNREWAEVERDGNRLANRVVEDSRAGFIPSN